MRIKLDTHTHTIASTHAYSTVLEMAKMAAERGLEAIAVTDHGVAMEDAPDAWHFDNLKNIPRDICGVKILYGVEANILDLDGSLDMKPELMKKLDVVNASIHAPCYAAKDAEDHTSAYEAVVKNPYVDIICHSGSPQYSYDYEKIVKLAKEHHKLMEINNHTFYVRKKSIDNCRKIAELCKKHGVGIVVSSDAHICFDLGIYDRAFKMLDEISFPEELIMNRDLETFENFMSERKKLFTWTLDG